MNSHEGDTSRMTRTERRTAGRRDRWGGLGKRLLLSFGLVAGLLLLAAAGLSAATLAYSGKYEGKILPGASIAGVDVGGLTAEEAKEAVREAVRPQLTRSLTIEWDDRKWKTTPKQLGAKSNLNGLIEDALAESAEATFFDKMQMRVFGEELEFTRDVALRYPAKGVRGFVEGIASGLNRDAINAELDYSSSWVEIKPDRTGRTVDVDASFRDLMKTLRTGAKTSALSVEIHKPEVTEEDFDKVLLLHIGDNRLFLYQDGDITHTYTVATGQPEYPTPTGLYQITEKRYMPTWINPDPDGWGKDMPESIGPGPDNPLGTRALNWDAPAIRFHGTQALNSLGYNASHGCVRLSMPEIEELYELVDVGTPIVSLQTGELKPMYASTPDPTPTAGDDRAKADKADD